MYLSHLYKIFRRGNSPKNYAVNKRDTACFEACRYCITIHKYFNRTQRVIKRFYYRIGQILHKCKNTTIFSSWIDWLQSVKYEQFHITFS